MSKIRVHKTGNFTVMSNYHFKERKMSLKAKGLCIILNTKDEELLELYKQYIIARDKMNAPLTDVGLVKLVERAKRLSKNNVRVEKIILETAIINNWKNVYLPREQELAAVTNEITDELRSLFGLE